jgi:GDPmannose 4,6-dehydratase
MGLHIDKQAMKKAALITGITGQDGSYLAELLLGKGYAVHGIVRRVALEDPAHHLWRIRHLLDDLQLHAASMESYASIFRVVEQTRPDECYHLAAQSFVSYSFEDEFSTIATNVNGTHFVLSAIKERAPDCRFYFAASSEMFGLTDTTPQDEETPFRPRSPYGISKLAGYHLTRNYREAYGLYACNGICFNHESERRGFEFVTRKVTRAVAAIKQGTAHELRLGNLDARRDWGYAPDFVHAMWEMLQQDTPDDYVIATGESHTVREFVQRAFGAAGLDWETFVVVDERLYRPAEVHELRGNSRKARERFGWAPTISFSQLVNRMVEADVQHAHDAVSERTQVQVHPKSGV